MGPSPKKISELTQKHFANPSPRSMQKLKLALYQTRECGLCRACCTTEEVTPLGKDVGVPCPHLERDPSKKGCGVHGTGLRPKVCEQWACLWRSGTSVMNPDERPDRVGIVLDSAREGPEALTAREAFPGAFLLDSAKNIIHRLAQKRVVALLKSDSFEVVRLYGPAELQDAYREWGGPHYSEDGEEVTRNSESRT